jgi:Methyltransferase domain
MRVVRRRAGVVLRAAHLWPTTRARTRRLATSHDRLREDVAALKVAVKEARAAAKASQKRIATLEAELKSARDGMGSMLPGLQLLFGRRLPGMNRAMPQDVLDTLIKEVSAVTQAKRADHHVATGYATLFELEARGLGRIAGTTQNVVGKLTTTPLLSPPNDEILEIGTLFGMHAAGLARQFARHGRTAMLTIIDPLDGLQLQGGRNDQVDRTGVPVVEGVVRLNFTLAGFPDSQLRVIKGFSQDQSIRAQAADRRYGTIVVDGDHSPEGVARDLLWAESVVADRGIIVLDDYGDPKWPGVQEAVDAHLKNSARFSMIGTVATSAYLRAASLDASVPQ